MPHSTTRIGIVGAGANTKLRHIPGLQAIDGVKIVSVANRRRESAEQVAAEFGIPQVYDDWTRLVAARDIDAVVIGTWPYLHCPVTLAALDAGKHVLCEARMAMNALEARTMRDAARAHPQSVAQLVPAPMTLRVDATVKRLLDERYLGDLLALHVRAGGQFLDREAPLHWRQDERLSGLNVMSLGIWYEIVMRWVGPATRVTAMGKTFASERYDEAGKRHQVVIPDHLEVLAELECGAQASFQISSVTGLDDWQGVRIFGTQGTLHVLDDALYGGRKGDSRLQSIDIPLHEAGRWRVEEEFIGAIRGLEKVRLTTFDDGLRYMEFTAAVAESVKTGAAITIGEQYTGLTRQQGSAANRDF
jgi:predicted dehydrogenase